MTRADTMKPEDVGHAINMIRARYIEDGKLPLDECTALLGADLGTRLWRSLKHDPDERVYRQLMEHLHTGRPPSEFEFDHHGDGSPQPKPVVESSSLPEAREDAKRREAEKPIDRAVLAFMRRHRDGPGGGEPVVSTAVALGVGFTRDEVYASLLRLSNRGLLVEFPGKAFVAPDDQKSGPITRKEGPVMTRQEISPSLVEKILDIMRIRQEQYGKQSSANDICTDVGVSKEIVRAHMNYLAAEGTIVHHGRGRFFRPDVPMGERPKPSRRRVARSKPARVPTPDTPRAAVAVAESAEGLWTLGVCRVVLTMPVSTNQFGPMDTYVKLVELLVADGRRQLADLPDVAQTNSWEVIPESIRFGDVPPPAG